MSAVPSATAAGQGSPVVNKYTVSVDTDLEQESPLVNQYSVSVDDYLITKETALTDDKHRDSPIILKSNCR